MNKGIEIWLKKKQKHSQKSLAKLRIIKPEQENICQFVLFSYLQTGKMGTLKHSYYVNNVLGLQVKNKIFLDATHYKYVASKGVKINVVYHDYDFPKDIPDVLLDKYQKEKRKND